MPAACHALEIDQLLVAGPTQGVPPQELRPLLSTKSICMAFLGAVCALVLVLDGPSWLPDPSLRRGPHGGRAVSHTLSSLTARYEVARSLLDGRGMPEPPHSTPVRATHLRSRDLDNPLARLQKHAEELQKEFQRRTNEFREELDRRSAEIRVEWSRRVEAFFQALSGQGMGNMNAAVAQAVAPPMTTGTAVATPAAQAAGAVTAWQCNSMWYESPRYTGIIWLPIRRNANSEIECMSLNAKDCGWQKEEPECQTVIRKYSNAALKPLACGEMHLKVWKETGYEKEGHWCASGRKIFPKVN